MHRRYLMPALVVALLVPASAQAAPPKPFGHDCQPKNGVLFCPTTGDAQRVKSFDGTPLDVDVTLPAQGDGPFPTIVMMHGFGGNKANFEQTSPEGDSATTDTLFHYNNVHFAQRGYAVLNYSARGFGRSCGQQKTAPSTECASGFIRLADSRFEVRDTQTLLGMLADQGVSQPTANGVTGISYGGGQSMQLAFLKDRIRMPDGSFAPWVSPAGKPMAIAAAYPKWPWSDLVASLTPNGRYLDYQVSGPEESRSPLGVPISSYVQGLFALGSASGYFCGQAVGSTPCTDSDANISTQFVRLQQGEPEDAAARAIGDTTYTFRSGASIPGSPSPLLMQSGWTDDLFPVSETLRIYNRVRAADPDAPVSLQYSDLGHSRGSNKTNSDRAFNDQGTAFFDAHLKGSGAPPAPGSVLTFTQTCPAAADAGGPFTAPTWAGVHPGAVRFGSAAPQTASSSGGNPDTARRFDPVGGTSDACQTIPDETAPGTATYRGPPSQGFTLLGRPTVTARIQTTGQFGQIASRLWDVAPDGSQRLISRGIYRLLDNQTGPVTLQLQGNGYRFEPGHTPKLELLGRDNASTSGGGLGTGYLRASNGPFTVAISDLSIELPTAEAPNRGQIVAPQFAIDPAARPPGEARRPLTLSVTPSRTRAGSRTRFRFAAAAPERCPPNAECLRFPRPVPRVLVRFAGRSVRTNGSGQATMVLRLAGAGSRVARATKGGFVPDTASVTVVRRGNGGSTSPGTGNDSGGNCNRFSQTGGLQRYRCQRGNR